MILLRPIFSTMAGLYCLCLGVFALHKYSRGRANRLFAFSQFAVAWADCGEYAVWITDPTQALLFFRLTRVGACIMLPFFLDFLYEFMEVPSNKKSKTVVRISYIAGVVMSVLYLTPLITAGLRSDLSAHVPLTEIHGPLFTLFCLYLVVGGSFAVWPLPAQFKIKAGLKRLQIGYLLFAGAFGVFSLGIWGLSNYVPHLNGLHYPMGVITSFIFAYAIFKHHLIPAHLAFRRAILLLGIYISIFMLLIPLTFYFQDAAAGTGPSLKSVVFFLSISGLLFSLGPIIYMSMLKNYSLFQDKTTAEITHEFKTPLFAIEGAHNILQEELDAPAPSRQKIRDYLAMIRNNTERLQRFITNVLDYNRMDGKPFIQELEEIDLKDIWMEALQDFQPIQSRFQFTSMGATTLSGSREGLLSICQNLLSNAVKFCPKGDISIAIRNREGRIITSVTDHGIGIPADKLTTIFEPFMRGPSLSSHSQGSGLGLAIAKRWVDFHNGLIWAESKGPGHGATLTVSLPQSS